MKNLNDEHMLTLLISSIIQSNAANFLAVVSGNENK